METFAKCKCPVRDVHNNSPSIGTRGNRWVRSREPRKDPLDKISDLEVFIGLMVLG